MAAVAEAVVVVVVMYLPTCFRKNLLCYMKLVDFENLDFPNINFLPWTNSNFSILFLYDTWKLLPSLDKRILFILLPLSTHQRQWMRKVCGKTCIHPVEYWTWDPWRSRTTPYPWTTRTLITNLYFTWFQVEWKCWHCFFNFIQLTQHKYLRQLIMYNACIRHSNGDTSHSTLSDNYVFHHIIT